MAIPAGQRWVIYAIALAFALIAGRWADGQDRAAPRTSVAYQAERPVREAAGTPEPVPEVRLDRPERRAAAAPAGDLFPARSWEPPQAATPRYVPPPPQAPALPFQYLGRMIDAEQTTVFLSRQDRAYVVRLGDTLDGNYRLETIAEDGLALTYLPLGTTQTLAFAATPVPSALGIAPAANPPTLGVAPVPHVPAVPGVLPVQPAAPTETVALALSAPAQATIGHEFVMNLSLPARNEGGNATIELSYDPAVLSAIGKPPAAPSNPGRTLVSVEAPAVVGAPAAPTPVRFRVVAGAPTTTEVRIVVLSATDAADRALGVRVPAVRSVSIVAARSGGS